MTLLELMQLISLAGPSFGAVAAGWRFGGALGILSGMIVGLVVGLSCFGGSRAFSKWITCRPTRGSKEGSAWSTVRDIMLFLGLIVWIMSCTFVGQELTARLLREIAAA